MQLHEAIEKILKMNDSYNVIFAKKDWNFQAEAVVDKFASNYEIPDYLKENGYEYFLEYSLIEELSHIREERVITPEEFVNFIIYYAENDAYPDWANELT